MAAAALEQSEKHLNGNLAFLTRDCEVAFHRTVLAALPLPLLGRALRLAVTATGGQLDFDQTRFLRDSVRTKPKGAITCEGGGVVVEWDAETIHVRQLLPVEPFRYPLMVPGEIESAEFGWRIIAQETEAKGFERPRGSLDVVVSLGSVSLPLHLRCIELGDKIVPLGMTGSRKLSDAVAEAGLTQAARRRIPVICDFKGPIWVPGIVIADRAKVCSPADRALRLVLEPIGLEYNV